MKHISVILILLLIAFFPLNIVAQFAGNDQTVCEPDGPVTLNATPPDGTWSTTGNAVIMSVSSSVTTVTNLDFGPNEFIWTTTNGSDMVIITDEEIKADADSDFYSCEGTTTLNANNPFPGSGFWSPVMPTSPVFSAANNSTTDVSGLEQGTNIFRWNINYNSCSSFDDITVIYYATGAGISEPEIDLQCDLKSVNLSAVTPPAAATGLWSVVSGNGIFSFSTQNFTDVSELAPGENLFRWTVTNGPCSTSADIKVTTYFTQTPFAGGDRLTCNQPNSQLEALQPTTGTGSWTVSAGSGIISNSLLYNSLVSNLSVGNNTFTWTVDNGDCGISSDDVIYTNYPAAIANAGKDSVFCDTTNYTLQANEVQDASGYWSIVLGNCIFTDSNQHNTDITNIGPGDNMFRWTVNDFGCETTDEVLIHRDLSILATAGNDSIICGLNTRLEANTPTQGFGIWTFSPVAGLTISDATDPLAMINNLPGGGSVTFTWTITNGSCISSDNVTLTNDDNLSAYAGLDESICTDTYVLAATTTGNGLVSENWSIISGFGQLSNSSVSSTTVSNLNVGDNLFRWTVSDGICDWYDDVIIHRDQFIQAYAGVDETICTVNYQMMANDPLPGGGEWTGSNVTQNFSDISSPSSQVSNLSLGTSTFTWTITNGTCISSDNVIITRGDASINAIIYGPDTVCTHQPNADYSTDILSGYNYNWLITGGVINTGQNTGQINVDWGNQTIAGNVQLTIVNSDGCEAVNSLPVNIGTSIITTIIQKSETLLICTDSGMVDYQWYLNGTIIPGATKQFYWSENLEGDFTIQTNTSDNCPARSNSINVRSKKLKIYPNPAGLEINISLNNELSGEMLVFIKDLSGKNIKMLSFEKSKGFLQMRIPVNEMKPGIYGLELYIEGHYYKSELIMIE